MRFYAKATAPRIMAKAAPAMGPRAAPAVGEVVGAVLVGTVPVLEEKMVVKLVLVVLP